MDPTRTLSNNLPPVSPRTDREFRTLKLTREGPIVTIRIPPGQNAVRRITCRDVTHQAPVQHLGRKGGVLG